MIREYEKSIRAIANEYRKRILEILYDKKSCRYSELLKLAGFNLGESGRFAYHLKKLLDYGLIKQLPNGKYTLTSQGANLVRILREEVGDSPTIIDVLDEFPRKIDTNRFIIGNLLLACGEVFLIIGALFVIQGLLNIPARIEFFGTILTFHVESIKGLILVIIGSTVLTIGLKILKRILPTATILELLIYQKYALLFASRSKKLGRYLGYYGLALIIVVAVIFGMFLF